MKRIICIIRRYHRWHRIRGMSRNWIKCETCDATEFILYYPLRSGKS